ncbi:Zinc finger CCCH domain-containing protein 40 [Balamuthia mandrillaris]
MSYWDKGHQKKSTGKAGWESSEFPIVCETCLGDNPYIRMTKANFDKECKVCARPFTVFRWKPGTEARHKKTEICQVCAKLKNICQTCLLDLEFGLPVQVRDSQVADAPQIPYHEVNREYFAEQAEREVAQGRLTYGKMNSTVNESLRRLQRTEPYYKRNRTHVCSFWLKGECNRGNLCPYRHENPEQNEEMAKQNIKDRYYGVNDPVARKLLSKASTFAQLLPPEDPDFSTLYVGNVNSSITEADLRDHFYAYGEITKINVKADKQCAFITYKAREEAERAVATLGTRTDLKGVTLRLSWARQGPQQGPSGAPSGLPPPPAAIHGMPPPPSSLLGFSTSFNAAPPVVAPPPGISRPTTAPPVTGTPLVPYAAPTYYPSMNPNRMEAKGNAEPKLERGAPC